MLNTHLRIRIGITSSSKPPESHDDVDQQVLSSAFSVTQSAWNKKVNKILWKFINYDYWLNAEMIKEFFQWFKVPEIGKVN